MSHYLNQCWIIVNWILRNKLQWYLNQNTKVFIPKNAFENTVWEMVAILSRGRWVKSLHLFIKVVQYYNTFYLSYCTRFFKMISLYKGGLATWSHQISHTHVGNHNKISSLIKHTPHRTQKKPHPAQQVDLGKKTNHDDVIKWKHFPRNWPFVREIHRSLVNFPHKGQWRGALMFSLIYAWINDWVNNHEAGDLRRQHGHYDVIVMFWNGLEDMSHW